MGSCTDASPSPAMLQGLGVYVKDLTEEAEFAPSNLSARVGGLPQREGGGVSDESPVAEVQ